MGEDESISRELLRILPRDGVPIPNRAARALISKRLGEPISNETYFAGRNRLLERGIVGRVRGQGGSVFLLSEPPAASGQELEESAGSAGPSERDLMQPLHDALKTSFTPSLDLPKGAPPPIIEDTSTKGPKRGIWAHPDFVFVSVSKFSILPGAHVDTHVFELKNEAGGGLKAVHEALAQARYANFSHFVWHVPDGSIRELEIDEIATHCALHGVGFMRLRTLPAPALEVIADPRRTATTSLEVDGFLESRLSSANKSKLAAAISQSSVR